MGWDGHDERCERGTHLQKPAPLVQYLLQHSVHVRVQEGGVAARRGHGVVEDGAHGHAHHADVLGGVGPLGGAGEDVVEDRQHVAVVADLLVAGGVLVVWLPVGDLIPHLAEEHADAGVGLDEVLELLEHGDEALGVLVYVVDLRLEPFLVNASVGWEPTTRPGWTVS